MKVELELEYHYKHPSDMEDGEIAIITAWPSTSINYNGRVVQRYKDKLITLGAQSGESWSSMDTLGPLCRVRTLEPGEKLVIK